MAQYPSLTSVKYKLIEGQEEFKNLSNSFDSEARQQVKRKTLYPRRIITLQYENLSHADLHTLLEFYKQRYGTYQAFTFHFPTQTSQPYDGEYVCSGDGSTTVFNLPFVSATSITIYYNGSPYTPTDYELGEGLGLDGMYNITFDSAPPAGYIVTADFTGALSCRCRFVSPIEYSRTHSASGFNNAVVYMRSILLDEA